MRIGLTVVCVLMPWNAATCLAEEPPSHVRKLEPIGVAFRAALREASAIALKQDEEQHYWTDLALLRIGSLQMRVAVDGALWSICGSGSLDGRDMALRDLAEEVARSGDRERALEILRLQNRQRNSSEDYVDLWWIEHLIASNDLARACKALERLKSKPPYSYGLLKLAVAYAKAGAMTRATEQFNLALDAAANLKEDRDRAWAFCEIADAQLSIGEIDAAKETIRRLVERGELKDPLVKVWALADAAVLAAKANDTPTAQRLFRWALDAQVAVDRLNRLYALSKIAVAQASVGYLHDAQNTAWMIKHNVNDFSQNSPREEALCAIAAAQERDNDREGAVRTALSIEYFLQYRDDALRKIVEHQIAKKELETALAIAEKTDNPSRKAVAILKVATAYAKSGDRKRAAAVAARIELTGRTTSTRFDYRLPCTWVERYDAGFAVSNGLQRMWLQRAAEVAEAAMALSLALGEQPEQLYAILFNESRSEEVTRALARAHAFSGPNDALGWARQIGSNGKAKPKGTVWSAQLQIFAIIGVGEGILDRSPEGIGQPVQ
jgi:tetratricopeptide (TPR) repeat protein